MTAQADELSPGVAACRRARRATAVATPWSASAALGRAMALVVLAVTLVPLPSAGQSWEDLGPDAQREALRNFQHYQRSPEGARKRVERQWQRFQELDPAEKDRLRRNLQRWRELPPDTKQRLNDRYRSLRQGSR